MLEPTLTNSLSLRRCLGSHFSWPTSLFVSFFWMLLAQPTAVIAQTAQVGPSAMARDGRHDFDFNFGVWHTHIRRVVDPFSEGSKSIELNGTVTVRKVWEGRAQLEEIEADGPDGHWEGMTLFLYNPSSHQWSQSFANSKVGVMTDPLIGSFKEGLGELYAQDTFQDKAVLVRGEVVADNLGRPSLRTGVLQGRDCV